MLFASEEGSKDHSTIDWQRLATAVDTIIIVMGVKGLERITTQLIQRGRAPETPVALIRWGTTSEQYILIGALADISAKAATIVLEPPAVIVVGEVVNLAERLRWFRATFVERQQKTSLPVRHNQLCNTT